jgi:hypothetical protein
MHKNATLWNARRLRHRGGTPGHTLLQPRHVRELIAALSPSPRLPFILKLFCVPKAGALCASAPGEAPAIGSKKRRTGKRVFRAGGAKKCHLGHGFGYQRIFSRLMGREPGDESSKSVLQRFVN